VEPNPPQAGEAYRPPFLREISLAAEEVLAVGCKMDNMRNNVGPPTCVATIRCADSGS
jgi:hypothetical protein